MRFQKGGWGEHSLLGLKLWAVETFNPSSTALSFISLVCFHSQGVADGAFYPLLRVIRCISQIVALESLKQATGLSLKSYALLGLLALV